MDYEHGLLFGCGQKEMNSPCRCIKHGSCEECRRSRRCNWKSGITLLILLTIVSTYGIWSASLRRQSMTRMRPPMLASSRGLQTIDNDLQLMVSLVFIDSRFPDIVRIIGLGRIRENSMLYCHFSSGKSKGIVTAQMSPLLLDLELNYDGFFLICPLPPSIIHGKKIYVSISDQMSLPGSVIFPVHRYPTKPKHSDIAACVAPIHGAGNPTHVAAWIEMNRILGVKHFYFYNFSIPLSLQPLLVYYQKINIIDVIDWRIEIVPTSTVGVWPPPATRLHYFGQFAANNDCLYRAGRSYKYIMFTDFDEIIFPKATETLLPLISKMDNASIAEFAFRNSYMRSDFPKLSANEPEGEISIIQRIWRENRVLPDDKGTKVIVKFEDTLVMGIHSLMTATALNKVKHVVPIKEALLLHYRDPPLNLAINDSGINEIGLKRLINPVIKKLQSLSKITV